MAYIFLHLSHTIRRSSKLLLSPAFIAISFASLALAENPTPTPAQGAANELDFSIKYNFPIICNTYGASITVYENVFTRQGTPDLSKPTSISYYYCPHPIIDLLKMRQEFATVPVPGSNEKADKIYTLPLHVDFLMDQVETELATALTNKFQSPIAKSQINRMPVRGYEIFATVNGEEIVLFKIPLSVRGNPDKTFQDDIQKHLDLTITGPYEKIKTFVAKPVLSARAFLNSAAITTDAVSIIYDQLNKDGFIQNLNGQGRLNQQVQYSSSSQGGGFSIVGIGAAGTANSGQQNSSLDRYVTRDFMLNAMESGQAQIHIYQYLESAPGPSFDSIRDKLVQFMLSQMEKVQARFVEKQKGVWDLQNSITGDALGLSVSLKDVATLTKGSTSLDNSQDNSFSYGGIKASDRKKLGFKDTDDIQWRAQGNILVPSSVTLYLYSQNNFQQRIQAYFSQDDIRFERTMLESSGPLDSEDYAGYMPPDIGNISASMIPWEKQTQEFRQSFLPADGREVPHGTHYFALISGLDANSPAAASIHVNLPDLRGVFLRGLNKFSDDTGSRGDGYQDPDSRAPGSPQMDEFKRHFHLLPEHWLEAEAGHGFNGWGYDSNSADQEHPGFRTGDSGGTETRPKNVAIYYYIRVN